MEYKTTYQGPWMDINTDCRLTLKVNEWRYQKPVVVIDKCCHCGTCEIFCPTGCITSHETYCGAQIWRTARAAVYVPGNVRQMLSKWFRKERNKMATTDMGTVKVLKGNSAAARAVLLCKPDVVAAYPITPQSPVVEEMSKFVATGKLDAEFVEVEGEHSAMSVLIGASSTGGRVFSATSSNGLAFMMEAYFYAATLRLPIVMVNVCRELAAPNTVLCSQQDILTMRDAGWIQIHAESCQEILDTIIMAYKLAEDADIQLPVNVCYDGHYLSHLSARVEIPAQADVDAFLPARELPGCRLDPEKPMMQGVFLGGKLFTEYRL